MTIAAISNTSANLPPPSGQQQSFGQLVNAIRSGDLDAAQQAYSAFTQTSAGQSGGPFAQAVSQIGDALQSGDLGKAQQALASLQQLAKGAHHHGGHHHTSGSDGDKSQPAAAAAPASTASTASSTSANLLDVSA